MPLPPCVSRVLNVLPTFNGTYRFRERWMASKTWRVSGAQRNGTRNRQRDKEREKERERENTHERTKRCGPRMTFQPRTERRRPENREGKNKSTGRANDVSTVRPTGAITNGILQSLRLYLPRRLLRASVPVPVARFQKNDRVSMRPGIDNRLALQIENHSRNAANQTVSTWNLISTLPPPPPPPATAASLLSSYARLHPPMAGRRNNDTTTDRRRTIRYRAALFFFRFPSAPFVSRFRYARASAPRGALTGRARHRRVCCRSVLLVPVLSGELLTASFRDIMYLSLSLSLSLSFLRNKKAATKLRQLDAETINATVKVASSVSF